MTPDAESLFVSLSQPFYTKADFWISTVLSLAGLIFSLLAFFEAKQARRAAVAAGTTVKLQTVVIELSEIAQHLDRLDGDIDFSGARDLLNETARKILRLIAPFQERDEFKELCANLKDALVKAKLALAQLEPTSPINGEVAISTGAVYFAMQGHFSNVGSLVAELMGLCEKRTMLSTS